MSLNLLVVGVSHRTAEVPLLERVSLGPGELPAVLSRLVVQPDVREALVVSTCNRVEVYAVVGSFHGGLADIGAVLAERAGRTVGDLAGQLYAHYGRDAARHAFRVAAGLDSMVVGEGQILGQFRDAYQAAAESGSTGPLLHELAQHALRTGKRVHAETAIDRAGQNIVTAALRVGLRAAPAPVDQADRRGTEGADGVIDVGGRTAVVIGAGSMGALALATLQRAGATEVYVANRSMVRAQRLARSYSATVVAMAQLPELLATVDLAIFATAAPAAVVTEAPRRTTPLLILDLAVPRDVAAAVGSAPMITLVDIEGLRAEGRTAVAADVAAAEAIVEAEVAAFVAWHREADVAPTVAALRARAEDVVVAELRRLTGRLPDLTDDDRAEVARTVHRVVRRLLHEPTVRVRQRATEPGGQAYATVLRELFDLAVPDDPDSGSGLNVPGALAAPSVESAPLSDPAREEQ